MFFYSIYKYSKGKNNKKKIVKTIIIGSIIYAIIYFLINSNFLKNNDIVNNNRKYFYYLFFVDISSVGLFYWRNKNNNIKSIVPKFYNPYMFMNHKLPDISKNIKVSKDNTEQMKNIENENKNVNIEPDKESMCQIPIYKSKNKDE